MATSKDSLRILLFGKTGSGKSATGNTILGESKFASGINATSVSKESELQSGIWKKMEIKIMNSPGLFDTKRSQKEIAVDIVQSMACLHPGPNVVLYVVRLGRYTREEYETYFLLKRIFDENIIKHMIIAFTYGDYLQREKKSIEDYIKTSSPEFQTVIQECKNRYVVFDNTSKKKDQVKAFIKKAEEMIRENGGVHYTCEVMEIVSQAVKQDLLERSEIGRKLTEKAKEANESIKRQQEENERKILEYRRQVEQLQQQMKQESEKNADILKKITKMESEMKMQNEKFQQELKRLEQEKADVQQKRFEEELRYLKDKVASPEETSWVSDVADVSCRGAKALLGFLSEDPV